MDVKVVVDDQLRRAFHSAVLIMEKLYIFGGIGTYQSTAVPFCDVVQFDLQSLQSRTLCCENNGPERSHHAAAALPDSQMCIVGGWNGKQRTSDVFILNTETLLWTTLKMNAASHIPAGFSGHTCISTAHDQLLITGREGGVRMQRRFGSVFKLMVDKTHYSYTELPLHVASRSGHTCCRMNKGKKSHIVLYGGRDSDTPDIITNVKITSTDDRDSQLNKICEKMIESKTAMSCKAPKLRFHDALSCDQYSLMHGGEVFGKARETVDSSLYIHDSSCSRWWRLAVDSFGSSVPHCSLHRMGHRIIFAHGKLYVVGGIGNDGRNATASILILQLS